MLDQTPQAVSEREALRVNPARTCQPIGAMYAALGIHSCLPHSHGSQGCCAYHRSHLTRHYKEPVMAGTSSFTEGASVFGGGSNLTQAITNIFAVYDPEVIAVNTTCLSETIGDDLGQIITTARDEGLVPPGKEVFYASTPSYRGSHVTGFSGMAEAMARHFATRTDKRRDTVNLIPGYVEPADMRELKRLAELMRIPTIMFPDASGVLDTPNTGRYRMFPKGGVTTQELRAAGDSIGTLALGAFASEAAAAAIETKCGVPYTALGLPIGVQATDRLVETLRELAAVDVPDAITEERGRLLDLMIDMHQYFHGRRVAIFGDPDQVLSLTEFCRDLGMIPTHVLTGTSGQRFEQGARALLAGTNPDANIKAGGDLMLLHQWIKNEPVDLLIGNTYGKYIARAEDVPFVRFGWPILDRVGHQYFPTAGYRGGLRLAEQMLSALLDRLDRDSTEERFELVL
jgi:nitrogenase molybdenum-iron protein beta chain